MPHKHSELSKQEINLKKSEKKWLDMIFAAIPTLCQRFHVQYNSENDILQWVRANRQGLTLIASHNAFHSYYTKLNDKYNVTLEFNFRTTTLDLGFTTPVLVLPVRVYRKKVYIEPQDVRLIYRTTCSWRVNPFNETTQAKIHTIVYEWLRDTLLQNACKKRSQHIKEGIVAAVWRPDRVARRLEEGGWEAVEAFE